MEGVIDAALGVREGDEEGVRGREGVRGVAEGERDAVAESVRDAVAEGERGAIVEGEGDAVAEGLFALPNHDPMIAALSTRSVDPV